jgi:hypothetical protein
MFSSAFKNDRPITIFLSHPLFLAPRTTVSMDRDDCRCRSIAPRLLDSEFLAGSNANLVALSSKADFSNRRGLRGINWLSHFTDNLFMENMVFCKH